MVWKTRKEFRIWDPTYFHYDLGGAEYKDNVDFEVVVPFVETGSPRKVEIFDKATGEHVATIDLGDTLHVFCDAHPDDPDCQTLDLDNDDIRDLDDNCWSVANPKQEDTDKDGLGNACDEIPLNGLAVGIVVGIVVVIVVVIAVFAARRVWLTRKKNQSAHLVS